MTHNESTDLLLNKYCNELNSDDKRQRKRALENIRKEILGKEIVSENVSYAFDQVVRYLIRCFKDSTEAVRETSVILVTDILRIIPPKEVHISNLMPIVSERLSGEVILENSEEVRLCLIILLSELISKYDSYLSHYLNDFINIFVKTIIDPYPRVKKESCDCAAQLAKTIPQYFHMQSESLIPSLIQTLTHQQYRIRVAGIYSIGAVVRYGNNKSVNDVCGPLAERLFDQHHAVRAAVSNVVGTWLLELPDRYSYFAKLVPLMLTCLSDEIPEHRRESEELWSKVGLQYMKENESDLKEKMDYLQETLEHYPANVQRPNLGCRTLVQRELSKYLPAIATELEDWKGDVRVKSAQLLCVTVQHAESNITQHLERTLPPLYRACGDSDPRISDNIERAAEMIGYFVPPDVFWRLAQSSVQESSIPGPLHVLAAVICCSQRAAMLPLLQSVADTIASDVVCYTRQGPYQKQLLNVVCSIQHLMQQDTLSVAQQLFDVVVSVLGLAADQTITERAKKLLDGLAQVNDIPLQELYKRHTPALLDRIAVNVNDWTLLSPQRFVFEAILTNAGPVVGLNIVQVLSVLETCLNSQLEPEAILQTLMAVSYVLTNAETLSLVENLPQVIQELCTRVLHPQLVWKAGRSAEALRTAAVACVVAALELAACSRLLAESLMPLLLTLVEDSAVKTRQFTTLALLSIVRSLKTTGELNAQDINSSFIVIMKRLDDNNDKVRESAVRTLKELFRTPLPSDYSVECYRASIEALYDTLLLHLDDPMPSFQDIMLDALKEMSSVHPQLLKSRIQKDNFRSKAKCEQLIDFLDSLRLE